MASKVLIDSPGMAEMGIDRVHRTCTKHFGFYDYHPTILHCFDVDILPGLENLGRSIHPYDILNN